MSKAYAGLLLLLVCGGWMSAPVGAQTPPIGTPTSAFLFDQPAPDAATAAGYVYKIYVDGATTGQTVAGVTCAAGPSAGLQACRMPFPAFTPGAHSVQLTASNAAGESAKSTPFAFTLVAIPGTPGNIRIGQ